MKITVSLIFLVGLLAGCTKAPPAVVTGPRPVAVRTTVVEFSTMAIPVRVSGVLARRTEAELSFKIGGLIESVAVRAGDVVKPRQVLARLRPDEIEAQVTQARSAVDKARRDLARVEKLQSSAVATLENLQDSRTGLEQAEAQLRIVEFNRQHAEIVAPAAGRILRRNAEPNELVAPGRAVLTFAAEADGWIVRAGLAERDVARVRIGDRAEVLGGGDAVALPGRVIQISDAADAGTRTTEVEIALEQAPLLARSGFVAAVTLLPAAVAERPVVPAATLIEGDAGRASLFLIDDGQQAARRVVVEIETLLGARAYLRTALPHGARLVVAGGEYLRDGALVTVAN
jgi:RND family efflux transporter MFP subunit